MDELGLDMDIGSAFAANSRYAQVGQVILQTGWINRGGAMTNSLSPKVVEFSSLSNTTSQYYERNFESGIRKKLS